MKKPRVWLTIAVPIILLAVTGLVIIIIGDNGENRPIRSEDQATEVTFITGDEIQALLSNDRYTMIEFGGRSCNPCKEMLPILAELITAHGEVIDIVNLYLDDDYAPADSFDVYLLPTQIIFDQDGEELSRHLGFWLKADILAEYQRLGIIE